MDSSLSKSLNTRSDDKKIKFISIGDIHAIVYKWFVEDVKAAKLLSLINDALQIHRAFRSAKDQVLICAVHIPFKLIKNKRVKLIANTAIDLDYNNSQRDFEIKDFIHKDKNCSIDYSALKSRGIDLNELYVKGLPWNLKDCEKANINQEFFLLNINKIKNKSKIKSLFENTLLLKKHQSFLHGFFGDQNIFARRFSKYLPVKCYNVYKK